MEFLPIFLNIKNKPCTVIGGGEVATRKIRLMLKAGGKVKVISPELCQDLANLADKGKLEHIHATTRRKTWLSAI